MAVDIQYISAAEIAQPLRSAQLEQVYQKTLSQAERIYEEERARSLRVQLLLLEDDNDQIREQLDNTEDGMQKLETTNDDLCDQLTDIEAQYQAVQMELKAQLRDLDRYKAEVNALNAARTDANALLSEKLALSRELTILKPELEHLKSQNTTQQGLLSEKLALERELSATQVELETEKRAVQRLKAKDKNVSSTDAILLEEIEELKKDLQKERRVAKEAAFKDAARVERIEELEQELTRAKRNIEKSNTADHALVDEVEELKQQLEREKRKNSKSISNDVASSAEIENLKKELAKAKRDMQKLERENLKKAVEWDSQKETLEEKLDAFRTKLRTTKEQLKDAQEELDRAEQAKFAAAAEASKARMTGINPRKRNVARFDPDMTIGTPGHGGPAKRQRFSVNAGDKSNFSITPFLSKTMSILPESPEDRVEQEKADEALKDQIDTAATTAEVQPKIDSASNSETTTSKKAKATKKAPTAKTKASKPLQESTNPKANAAVKKSTLSKVVEEESEEIDSNQGKEPDVITKPKVVNKRPTIFDDDEDAAPKKTKKLNLGGLKAGGLSLGKVSLGSKSKVLAEFSPLKKDRRAAVAI